VTLPKRPIAFVLAATNHGSMIVNRNDHHNSAQYGEYGVAHQLLNTSCFDETEVRIALSLLDCRRQHFGEGVVAIDGGANIGVHSVEWARHMFGWGDVLAFEAQEVVFYALAGNIALNNCMNARVRLAALGDACGELMVPQPNYFLASSFGSLELRQRTENEFIGQPVSYDQACSRSVQQVTLDSLQLQRLDFIKLDVEGMEMDVLHGGSATIAANLPIMIVEIIKSDRAAIEKFALNLGYRIFSGGPNIIAVHSADPTLEQLAVEGEWVRFTG
jgi:FkbM family methyltransferase